MRSLTRAPAIFAVAALVVIVAACAVTGPGSGAPSPATGGATAIDHATGATDVVLRYDEGGGFAGPLFFVSQAPIFTLYGDGTVIFRDPTDSPPPAVGGVVPHWPFRTGKLDEEGIQALLLRAIAEGGLGAARTEYGYDGIADAPTTTFTLNAGGLHKTVSIYALGLEAPGTKDAPQRAAFAKLAARLRAFDSDGVIQTQEYAPERYRGVLFAGQPGDRGAKPWPWEDIKPSDFVVAAGPDGGQLPTHMLTPAQAKALGIEPYQGGIQGLTLAGPEGGTFYVFSLRPLLPDEEAGNES